MKRSELFISTVLISLTFLLKVIGNDNEYLKTVNYLKVLLHASFITFLINFSTLTRTPKKFCFQQRESNSQRKN